VTIQNASSSTRLAPLVRFSTPFLSLSFAVTLYTTGLIAWRIIQVQKYSEKQGIKKDTGELSSVLELLVESSVLYAASIFVFVVLLALKSTNQAYPQDIHPQIAVCIHLSEFLHVSCSRYSKGYRSYIADPPDHCWPRTQG
jgi:hypothetical protein